MIKETTINKYKTYIGKTIGSIKIEDIDLSKPNRIYFIGTCTSCNRKIKVRNDGLYPNRMGCSKCIGKWRSENFKKKYSNLLPKDIRYKYIHFKCNALNRNIPFNLTLEQVNNLCSKPCFYCNKERCLGIDRLNNSKEYSIDNCVPCCGSCNRMKMDLTLPFFLEQIKKIYLNHKESSTTISKESTSKAIVDGSGEHLYYKDGDIVYPT